jgi:hypothetical protein
MFYQLEMAGICFPGYRLEEIEEIKFQDITNLEEHSELAVTKWYV